MKSVVPATNGDFIQDFFYKNGIRLRKKEASHEWKFYPGSCDQCEMKKGGNKTILIPLTPYHTILICEKCNYAMKNYIPKMITHLQNISKFTKIPKRHSFYLLDENGKITSGWELDPLYICNLMENSHDIWVPLIHKFEKKSRCVFLRSFAILNDIPF